MIHLLFSSGRGRFHLSQRLVILLLAPPFGSSPLCSRYRAQFYAIAAGSQTLVQCGNACSVDSQFQQNGPLI
jgi:hypothetical protein